MEWTYHVEPVDFSEASIDDIQKQLNKLGRDGWEVVAAIPVGGRGVQSVIFNKPISK